MLKYRDTWISTIHVYRTHKNLRYCLNWTRKKKPNQILGSHEWSRATSHRYDHRIFGPWQIETESINFFFAFESATIILALHVFSSGCVYLETRPWFELIKVSLCTKVVAIKCSLSKLKHVLLYVHEVEETGQCEMYLRHSTGK